MTDTIRFGDLAITVQRKDVKHVHLSVHPPAGRVTLVAPVNTRLEVAHAYAASRLAWIREQQATLRGQTRESPRAFVKRESHWVWGRRYLLTVQEVAAKPAVRLTHRRIVLAVRPHSSRATRAAVMHEWHKALLHDAVPRMIAKWEPRLGVTVAGYFLRRMKTKWGSCNPGAGTIRLNTELVKKPRDLLEYVVVHELLHLIETSHSERFFGLMSKHYPQWCEARAELNLLPLSAQVWRE
jgi:predicted metal-dependent hydrolase